MRGHFFGFGKFKKTAFLFSEFFFIITFQICQESDQIDLFTHILHFHSAPFFKIQFSQMVLQTIINAPKRAKETPFRRNRQQLKLCSNHLNLKLAVSSLLLHCFLFKITISVIVKFIEISFTDNLIKW